MNLKEKHILIVEDNELNMEIIHTILDKYEAKIEEAYDGQQALEKIRQSKEGEYDLILMDIMMPVMAGGSQRNSKASVMTAKHFQSLR